MASNETKPGELPVFDRTTQLAFDALVATVMTNIVAVVPLIKAPGLNFVVTKIVSWILFLAWNPITTLVAFFIIDQDKPVKAREFKEATDELKQQTDNKPLDSEEVKKAHEEFKRKLGALIVTRPR